ncbi:DUF4349 domain-containing protein [Cellulomonas sp. T2.31MG-18]|uniref:DUF4349 domain-containing protein n=1 Tax=Cellulomonas sp. T2.31MG-18 TaxID=3157619 RepID=UPI003670562A
MRSSMPLTWTSAFNRTKWRPRRRAGGVVVAALVVGLVGLAGGCSADQRSSSSSQPNSAAQGDVNKAQAGGGAAAPAAGSNAAAGVNRQVVQTGELHLTVPDPVGTVTRVLAVVDQAGGRVDAHEETGRGPGTAGSATLTVRVPATQLEKTVQTLRGLGDVTSFTLQATDVTGTAEDLDARIDAARLSVARMQDLMSKATTTADLISTEQALSERQAALEQLQGQRAVLADQVALSTLRVVLTSPGEAPAPRIQLHSFADGWSAGLKALGAVARGALVALGVVGPWLLLAALVAVAAGAARRLLRRRYGARTMPPRPGDHGVPWEPGGPMVPGNPPTPSGAAAPVSAAPTGPQAPGSSAPGPTAPGPTAAAARPPAPPAG